MAVHTTNAIVLRRYPYRETSVIVSCLTERYGRLKGLVKGLRAAANRHRSAMEPLTINRIVFYESRSSQLHLITQCELLAPLAHLQHDLETIRSAALCAELADMVAPLEEPQPALYHLLKDTLERFAMGGGEPMLLKLHFIVRCLRLAGFQPRLDQCAGCNADVRDPAYWSAQAGGLLCRGCLHEDPDAEAATRGMLAAFSTLCQADVPVGLDAGLIPLLWKRLDEFLRWQLDRPLRTLTA